MLIFIEPLPAGRSGQVGIILRMGLLVKTVRRKQRGI